MSKKWIYPAGLVVVLLIAFFIYRKYHTAPAIQLSALELTDLNGEDVNLSTYKGKKIALCFGASWCGNCREELDIIKSLDKAEMQDVEVIVVSDEPLEKIKAFKEKREYPFTFLKMKKSFNDIGVYSIPTSYIVNTNFEIKKETVGYLNWKDPSTLQHLKKLMD